MLNICGGSQVHIPEVECECGYLETMIEELQEYMESCCNEVKSELSTHDTRITSAESAITNANNAIAELNRAIANANSAIEQANAEINSVRSAKQDILTAGDNIDITENVISADLDDYYTAQEVRDLLADFDGVSFEIVEELPTEGDSNVIYLLPNGNGYDQYVYADSAWAKVGNTDVDLSNYVTNEALNTALDDKQDKLIAGTNVQIVGDTISATDTKYTAGTNVQISDSNVISATDTKYTAATANPLMDGTVAVGTSANYARQDHRHPTDTTRAPLASPALTGTPTAPTNATASTANTQIATTAFVQNAINRRLPKTLTQYTGTNQSLATSTWTSIDAFTAPAAGIFIGFAHCAYAANSTGTRRLRVYRKTTSGTLTGIGCEESTPAHATKCEITIPVLVKLASGEKLNYGAYQTSGSALNISEIYVFGVFIPD